MATKHESAIVVGGCGFIGSNLVLRLVSQETPTTVIDSLADWGGGDLARLDAVRDRVDFRQFDVRQAGRHARLFRRASIVYVTAGAVGHLESMRRPQADMTRSCAAHLGLLNVLRRVNPEAKVVVTTTRQIYGRPQFLPVDESHPICPVDVNGIHWHAVESYYRLFQTTYGLRSVCLRLTNTYGPRMSLDRACYGFAPVVFREALAGRPVRLFGDGRQRRDFNFVDDVVDAILAAGRLSMERPEAYNLGDQAALTLRQFCYELTAHLPVPVVDEPFPEDRRQIDVGDYVASCEKFRRATGWEATTSPTEGIRRTVEYYRATRRRSPPIGSICGTTWNAHLNTGVEP